MNKVRDIFMYYGRDLDHSYPALRLNNTVAVLNKKAISQFESHMLLKLIMETHPNEISIFYNSVEDSVWSLVNDLKTSSKKGVPQFEEVYGDLTTEDLVSKIKYYKEILDERISKNTNNKKTILYFRINQSQTSRIMEELVPLLEYGRQVNMFVVLLIESGNVTFDSNFYNSFPIRICGAGSSITTSECMIGCNLATRLNEDMAFILWTANSSSALQKMFIPYYPDTFISKFIRIYSMKSTN